MVTELETIMIRLQKRYNIVHEIGRLTDELLETAEREDAISAALVLDMRREQMERHAACEEGIRQFIEESQTYQKEFYSLAFGPIERIPDTYRQCTEEKELWMKKKIYEIRNRTQALIDSIRSRDERITRKVKQKK